jgi:hypothetical protein
VIYNSDGLIRVTVVDGSTPTGIQASDGSWNVVLNDGSARGIYHACGGLNAIVVTEKPSSIQAANGSVYVFLTDDGYVLYNQSKATPTITPENYDPVASLGDDLIEMWDASRSDTVFALTDATYTNAVHSWKGLVTGANLAQSTPNLKPKYDPTGLSGTPCITFNGTTNWLKCTDSGLMALLPTGTDPCEIWALCSQDADPSDATTRHVAGYANTSLANGRSISRIPVTGVNRGRTYMGTGASAGVATDTHVDLSGVHVLRGILGTTQTSVQVDGEALGTTSVTPATGTPAFFMVGSIPALAAANWWQGKISVIVVTKPLSSDKATALHNYLG